MRILIAVAMSAALAFAATGEQAQKAPPTPAGVMEVTISNP